ncbi:salt tolerance down-regulator-domain-containing protein [Cercophora scortea]|uniref:Stress response protein NST1 n=1 Tax=Cercophora scortea TaxID=314031 RepID=A0AAE0IGY5_9PEZI|nr:salt tolerance down-regulator-domain-containing protein [Cercophora scortea]
MKGNVRHPPAAASNSAPLSPTSKATAKYTNKDGSKFITVPKASTPVDSSQPSPTTAPAANAKITPQTVPGAGAQEQAQPINRKKQKRRAKAAAKAAAEQGQSHDSPDNLPSTPTSHGHQSVDAEPDYSNDEDDNYGGGNARHHHAQHQNGFVDGNSAKSKKATKKKKKKGGAETNADEHREVHHHGHRPMPQPHSHSHAHSHAHSHVHSHAHSHPHSHADARVSAPTPPTQHHRPGISREKIWNTSSQEERERIKEFWLGLSESERKSLVKVEKDAVLKKMKEQQKHTCSCTVCGRKRTAIEEELEGLYDAYYEELEQYAHHPQGDGPPMLRARRRSFGTTINGIRQPGDPSLYGPRPDHHAIRGQIVEQLGDEEEEDVDEEEEEFSDEEDPEEDDDDDDYSEEEPEEVLHRPDYATDFFNFGNSLTVQGRDRFPILPSFLQSYPFSGTGNNAYGSSSLGGILTVADDLLKNDGKKFIEMMEQLAERRMAREEDAREQFERTYAHTNGDRGGERSAHYHPPPDEEEEFEEEEEEEEEYDDEEEYDSQEEEDTMTEEQRMEEGRRMFQIFAARMFEQRVLTAYREKVAKERQAKLIEELEDESRQESQRKAKKAKEAQKRKDKAAKKREAQAAKEAQKEAEKAAEEAARIAEEARKAEEQRHKAEEKRKKREAQKLAEEEERKRRDAERLRKQQEREENDRKAREAREREKKVREEARLKEKVNREQKERETREKRDRDVKSKAEREAKDGREKSKPEEKAAQKAAAPVTAVPLPVTLPKRPAPHSVAAAVPALPQQPATATSFASPQIPVATPAFPKNPTPMRTRQASQQGGFTVSSSSGATSQSSSAPSQHPSPHPITPVHASPGPIGPPSKSGSSGTSTQSGQHPSSHSTSPMNVPSKALPSQPSPFSLPTMGVPFPHSMPQVPPGFGNPMHRESGFPPLNGFRPAPGMMAMPPGINAPSGGRGFPINPPPGFPGPGPLDSGIGMSHVLGPLPSHQRHGSGNFEMGTSLPSSQPISRPTPIKRPDSVVHGQRRQSESPSTGNAKHEVDAHLGSRALIDDTDEDFINPYPRGMSNLSSSGPRLGPVYPPLGNYGMDQMYSSPHNPWASPLPLMAHHHTFSQQPPPGFGPGPMLWGPPAPMNTTFGGQIRMDRPQESQSVALRKMLRRACEELAGADSKKMNGTVEPSNCFVPLQSIKKHVEAFNYGQAVDEDELLVICETEGNEVNGGGSFDVREDGLGQKSIRFVASNAHSNAQPLHRAVGAPSEIGSPIVGGGSFGSR